MSERGPVGGAGELTALVKLWRKRGEDDTAGGRLENPWVLECADELEAVLAAKAPHHRWPRIRHAAKAPQGVPANDSRCQHCAVADQFQCVLDNGHQGDCMFAEWPYRPSSEGGGLAANPGYPAPESTGGPQKLAAPPALPVPGPVSDTTIHHGMFPPKSIVHTGQAVGWYRCDGKNCPICGEAAAPKPAPLVTAAKDMSAQALESGALAERPTPAPGAERPTLDPDGNFVLQGKKAAGEICQHLKLPYKWPDAAFCWLESRIQGICFTVRETVRKREALAAAPPAPTWVCGNGDHACNLRGYCVNPNCDRHASAERVRRDDALNVITYFFDTHKGEILKTGPVCETLCARLRALPPSPEAK